MAQNVRIDENQIVRIMSGLKCGRDEAIEIFLSDKAIDRGERMPFDLDPETEKMAKKFANVQERKKKAPTVYNFDTSTKKRKENPTKSGIIAEIAQFLQEKSENACENVIITNAERQISFTIGENTYEFTLVQKRKPK
jgi:hypothetical protein